MAGSWSKMQTGTGNTTVTPTSNLILGGDVRFQVDFNAKTITFTTWELYTSSKVMTLSAGTVTLSTLGSSQFQYVCYNNNTIELINYTNIGTYTGYILFGVENTNIFPFSYPLNQIGVTGGIVYRNHQSNVSEWSVIGDSLSQGQGWWVQVRDEIWIPTVTNLAVSGMRMAMSGGMWTMKDSVTATTDFCTIMGGTNDEASIYDSSGNPTTQRGSLLAPKSTFDTNTFYGAYQTLIEGLLTKNPKMRIILMTPPRAWTDATATTIRSHLSLVGNDVKAIGAQYNLPVLDMYNLLGYNEINQTTFLQDGLHFTVDGYKRVAAIVCNAIRSNYYG